MKIEFATRRGKPSVLNALVARATGEIVVFGDARPRLDEAAVALGPARPARVGLGIDQRAQVIESVRGDQSRDDQFPQCGFHF